MYLNKDDGIIKIYNNEKGAIFYLQYIEFENLAAAQKWKWTTV